MVPIQVIQSIDIYFFALSILIIISLKSVNNPNGKTPQAKAFSILLFLNFLIIIADSITVLLDGLPGFTIRIILLIAAVFGFCLQILICLFWYWYARVVIFTERKLLSASAILQGIPAFACLIIALISCFTGWLFTFDENNRYQRGPLFMLVIIISFIYLVFGYYMIIRYRKNLEKRYFYALLSFVLPPSIGGVIQTFFYGVTLLWPGMTLSLLIIYIAIQNELLLLDDLTGSNNRRNLDLELRRKIANAKNSLPFALILIDIDNFRAINDRWGHVEGDQLLKTFTKILGTCMGRAGFIARYGSDEFAVIVEMHRIGDLQAIKERLWKTLEDWNETSGKQWSLSISLGASPFIPSDNLSQDNFFVKVDKLLCLDKIVPNERRFRGRNRKYKN